jgi:uncharacterized protein with FMN-binding domain
MRRAAFSLVATVAGLVLLLTYKSHSATPLLRPAALGPTTPRATPTPGSASSTPSTSARSTPKRTIYGQPVNTQYGTVQLALVVQGRRIMSVRPLQLPQQSGRDIEIDNVAVPQLIQETLNAQSAQIDMVSGATYTSAGYIQSLQSALDKL